MPKIRKLSPSNMRKIIAKKTTESFSKIPHYSVTVEVNVSSFLKIMTKRSLKISDSVIYIASRLLRRYELLNAFWDEEKEEICIYENVNIGYVVAVDDGILVPVIRNADKLSIEDIHNVRKELVNKVLTHKLLPDEYREGTFTVSNLGVLPVESFTGIINEKQSALLTMGSIYSKNDSKFLKLTLVCDHRLVDGYYAARFLTDFKEFLEKDFSKIISSGGEECGKYRT